MLQFHQWKGWRGSFVAQKRHVTGKPTVKRIQECHDGIILIEFSKINQMNAKNEKIVENEIFGLMMRWNRNHVFELIFMVSEHDIIQIIRTQGDFWGQPISHNTIIFIRSLFSRKFLDFIRISLDFIKKWTIMNKNGLLKLKIFHEFRQNFTKFHEFSRSKFTYKVDFTFFRMPGGVMQ